MNFTAIDFENNTKVSDNSVCNSSTLEAILILEYAPKGESKDYYLTLNFTGVRFSSDAWADIALTVLLIVCGIVQQFYVCVVKLIHALCVAPDVLVIVVYGMLLQ